RHLFELTVEQSLTCSTCSTYQVQVGQVGSGSQLNLAFGAAKAVLPEKTSGWRRGGTVGEDDKLLQNSTEQRSM
ncbi:hypothetical protein NHX12_034101, partial [Muraenolepis orangiensis]